MNLFAFNGHALNGAATQLIQAAANIVCSATVSPVATRNVLPSASVSPATAAFTAQSTHTQAAVANPTCTASIAATGKHTQAGAASLAGGASILATVLRVVQASADVMCTAQIIVIPASTLAYANAAGSGSVTATATKCQPGAASAAGSAEIAANPHVIRYVVAEAIAGGAQFRVEAKVNNKLDAYADIVGTAALATPNSGIVLRMANAIIYGEADVVPNVAYLHASTQAQVASESLVTAESTVHAITGAYIRTCAAEVVANATRIVRPAAALSGSAAMTATAVQNHAAPAVPIQGGCEIVANVRLNIPTSIDALGWATEFTAVGTVIRGGKVEADAAAQISAEPIVTRGANINAQSSAQIIAFPVVRHQASASAAGSGNVSLGGVVLRMARATAGTGTAAVSAAATRVVRPSAAVAASADVLARPGQRHIATAQAFIASAAVVANMRSNAESLDPPERTLRRPFEDTLMRRPYEITEMRRAA